MQMQITSISTGAQAALASLGARLVVIASSTGAQVRESVQLTPDNSLPLSVFYGDEAQATYRAMNANWGVRYTLLYGMARIPFWLTRLFAISALGAVGAQKRRHLRKDKADWQQGASAAFDANGKMLWRHVSRDPLDLGQPIERLAAALGKPVTEDMHLDYGHALDSIVKRHPLVDRLGGVVTYIFLAFLFILIAWLMTKLM